MIIQGNTLHKLNEFRYADYFEMNMWIELDDDRYSQQEKLSDSSFVWIVSLFDIALVEGLFWLL